MKILKFGGTSVGSPSSLKRVRDIIASNNGKKVIVVSAFAGVTNDLETAGLLAQQGDSNCFIVQEEIISRHQEVINELFEQSKRDDINQQVASCFEDLRSIVKAVFLIRELSHKSLESLLGIGERLSSKITAAYLGAQWKDSREFIKTTYHHGKNQVLTAETDANLKALQGHLGDLALFPGFIASNLSGDNTTLGRGGSDYTASLLAVAFNAEVLEIWTDVDGFMTADPKLIKRAYCINQLSYAEAMELSHFGAKVIYPPTIIPVHKAGIPLLIKNTFNPTSQGTLINNQKVDIKKKQVKGISSIGGISLITIQGIGMVGVTGISMRVFSSLARQNINVILISQASSENSITLAVDESQANDARAAIEQEFEPEIASSRVNKVRVDGNMAIVAIVGENMKHTPGISGHLFSSIGANGINVYSIAQGASELNISFVIKETDLRKTLNIVHEAFFLSDYVRLNLFLVGKGTVGTKLINKLAEQANDLMQNHKLQLRLAGIAGQKSMLVNEEGIDPASAVHNLEKNGLSSQISHFVEKIINLNLPNAVFVDCTASQEVASVYQQLLQNNISVVTANKIASSSSFETYSKLKKTALEKGVKFHYETNVGAGLPIISPINDLVKGGDKVLRLEAVLSGTLNYIANTLSASKPLSEVIEEAMQKGFSEPDPRVDLSGKDVARKILILAREAGHPLEENDVEVEPFVPREYLQLSSYQDFIDAVKAKLDKEMEKKRTELESSGNRMRYAARLLDGKVKVGLIEVDRNHPFYDLEGSNNVILIWTVNYQEHPLQIKGYGAGADVTATGVLADIIKVAN